jgi:hypothetical protein
VIATDEWIDVTPVVGSGVLCVAASSVAVSSVSRASSVCCATTHNVCVPATFREARTYHRH